MVIEVLAIASLVLLLGVGALSLNQALAHKRKKRLLSPVPLLHVIEKEIEEARAEIQDIRRKVDETVE
jgi:hypothetical protein